MTGGWRYVSIRSFLPFLLQGDFERVVFRVFEAILVPSKDPSNGSTPSLDPPEGTVSSHAVIRW